jgi:hypothetical protein
MVRSALIVACAYLILFSEGSSGALGVGPLIIAIYLASNLVVGRLQPEIIGTQPFNVTIAIVDTILIAASLLLSGQASVELVLLFLGVLVVAIAGLRVGAIAGVTFGLTVAYLLMMWASGRGSLTRSSMLLQVPFLLCAAMVYGWVTEAARAGRPGKLGGAASVADALAADLAAQLDAINQCQAMLSQASESAALGALDAIAAQNRQMQAKLRGVEAAAATAVTAAPNLARTAA